MTESIFDEYGNQRSKIRCRKEDLIDLQVVEEGTWSFSRSVKTSSGVSFIFYNEQGQMRFFTLSAFEAALKARSIISGKMKGPFRFRKISNTITAKV